MKKTDALAAVGFLVIGAIAYLWYKSKLNAAYKQGAIDDAWTQQQIGLGLF